MSPPVLVGGAARPLEKETTVARVVGAGTAGIAELLVFHPVRATASLGTFKTYLSPI